MKPLKTPHFTLLRIAVVHCTCCSTTQTHYNDVKFLIRYKCKTSIKDIQQEQNKHYDRKRVCMYLGMYVYGKKFEKIILYTDTYILL